MNVLPGQNLNYVWDVAVSNAMGGINTTLGGDRYDNAFIGTESRAGNSSAYFFDGSHAGVWTVPEPATVILLAAGLLVLSASLSQGRARG